MVNSQVKRQSRQKGVSPGGFEQTAFQDAFSSLPARMRGKRKIGRFSKTLKNISLNAPAQSVPVIGGQGQSPALEAYLAQNLRATFPHKEVDALARAAALKTRSVTPLFPITKLPTCAVRPGALLSWCVS